MEWITCESVYNESWRRLLEYANHELAIEAISKRHGEPGRSALGNYKKQARQARVSLLQAKEYFEAARTASLFTKPNHIYYGMVSLSTACMLIRGTGDYSLDKIRQDPKNKHHGLEFSFSSSIDSAKKGMSLFENSFVKICRNGHFKNWYENLRKNQPVAALKENKNRENIVTNYDPVGHSQIPDFTDIDGIKKNLDFLAKRLPDVQADLARYGVNVGSARGEHKVHYNFDSGSEQNIFIFHEAPNHEALVNILNGFSCSTGVNFSFEVNEGETGGIVRERSDVRWSFEYPNSRETLDHKKIFFRDTIETPEIVDMFMVAYALSMLSRYFPDVWVSFLESHCKGAKLVEQLTSIMISKTPVLMLNQLSERQYVISNHRPFWH